MLITKGSKTLSIIILLFSLALPIYCVEIETSVVNLFVFNKDGLLLSDPFFELIDKGEHILLPFTPLSAYLDINLEYLSKENIVIASFDDVSVTISQETYTYIEHPEWSTNPPQTVDGQIYVSPDLFEFLCGATIKWAPNFQEVAIEIPFTPSWLQKNSNTPEEEKSVALETKPKALSGNDTGIDLIRYKLKSHLLLPQKSYSTSLDWQLFGRVADFSIALNGDIKFNSSDKADFNLKQARAKYENGPHFLVLGDQESLFEDSLGKQFIRGLTYTYTQGSVSSSFAYSQLSGEVVPGSTVLIYINNQLVRTLTPEETKTGFYEANGIALAKLKLNYIHIVAKDPSGTITESNYQVVGQPRIYLPNTVFLQAATGYYRAPEKIDFEGTMAGISTRIGGKKYSLWNDLLILNRFDEVGSKSANRLSLYTQPWSNFLLDGSVYFLPGSSLGKTGGSLYLHTYFPRSFCGLKVYSLPVGISEFFKEKAGNGQEYTLMWMPDEYWLFQLLKSRHYVPETKINNNRLALSMQKTLQTPSKATTTLTYFTESFDQKDQLSAHKTQGLMWKYRERALNSHIDSSLILKQNLLSTPDVTDYPYEELEITASVAELFGRNYLLSHSLAYKNNTALGQMKTQNLTLDASAKGTIEGVTASLTLSAIYGPVSQFQKNLAFNQMRLRLIFDQIVNKQLRLSSNLIRVWQRDSSKDSSQAEAAVFYLLPQAQLKAGIDYQVNHNHTDQKVLSGTLELKKPFANGLTFTPQLKVSLANPSNTFSYFIGFELSQSIGLASSRFYTFTYSDEPPLSYITGRAFLDTNQNNLLDPHEEVLAEIPIKLDNYIDYTDDKGRFLFSDILPGEYILGFDEYQLPADYTPLTDNRLIVLKEYESAEVDLPLTILGNVTGVVFWDLNENGIRDDNEPPVTLATVMLDNKEKTITDSSGNFLFDRIKLGKVSITIDKKSLPQGAIVPGEMEFDLTKENNELNISLPIVLKTQI